MFMIDITGIPVKEKVDVKCDKCNIIFQRRISAVKASRKKRDIDEDYCSSCAAKEAAKSRPQCTKEYWISNERKKKHSESVKNSDAYYESIKNRDTSGSNNGMWNRKHSADAKKKMSIRRIGKFGEKSPNWKGGKDSLNRRVKSGIQRRHKWFHRVIDRDDKSCQQCGATKKLDAHHIKPISNIIKDLLETVELETDDEKLDWLLSQPEIIDAELKNGITLCRNCHKKVHKNWGSHNAKIR